MSSHFHPRIVNRAEKAAAHIRETIQGRVKFFLIP